MNNQNESQRPSRRPDGQRNSVPSAREELDRQRALYSQHDPNASLMREREGARVANPNANARPAASNRAGRQNNPISNRAQRASQAGAGGNAQAVPDRNPQATPGRNPQTAAGRNPQAGASRDAGARAAQGAGQPSARSTSQNRTSQNAGESSEFAKYSRYGSDGQRPSRAGHTRTGEGTARDAREGAARPAQAGNAAGPQRRTRRNAATAGAVAATAGAAAAGSQAGATRQANAAPGQANAAPGQGRSAAPGPRPSAAGRNGQPGQSNAMPAVQNVSEQNVATYSRANYRRGNGNAGNAPDTSAYSAARYTSNRQPKQKANFFSGKGLIAICIVAVLAVVGVFGVTNWMANKAVQVTLNGDTVTISGSERSIGGLLDAGRVKVTAGNYVAVDGSTIRQGDGTRCTAKVNGNETTNMGTHLNGGDKIEISNGTDITEPYTDSDPQTLPHSVEIKGSGAVHLYSTDAQDGEQVTRTGKDSGITAQVVTKEAKNTVVQYYNVDTGGEKVIALTFDDGPWDSQTDQVLDILEQNGAKATFFTVGQCISGHETQVKRAAEMGCEIGTHTWDHAEGSGQGVSLIKMSSQERKDEVTKGLDAIEKATGTKASTIFRCPGGNYDKSVATDLEGLVTAEIGWNIDTTDWKKPGADTIAQRIESATPGNIILMHDGGGDRSQTIEGLSKAVPALKAKGYTFVTVQELIEKYPYKGN